ncbi:MAG: 50S ribosomal protein L6 [Candidatus Spechtbacteria bacterium RIFCSPLOWO2_02_FULL_38_8]|uniref:Large ribosomal subunit protein uL6 n=1 Tax=Candidatus Spechtbacteria bacterium RIFCSPLOWO2_02_FULL_38_8 TaxID=1802164 RepID=A0A1G2HGF1_9BACT|nr:MAG: 50S ribosomal protein L6 [Candidatus Spechtbacteria bacterium RIFCSPLOWO2_02_FULL_38_8]
MSRIGKQPITIPEKVDVDIQDNIIKIKGPLGELELEAPKFLDISKIENKISLKIKHKHPDASALWGLFRALIANMVLGVSEGFKKELIIEGVGFRAEIKENELFLNLGFSHPVIMKIPENVKIEIEKSRVTISGIDKQLVGQFAADIRGKKKPEPYKGKGIRYEGEHIRRKSGKRAAGGPGGA